jgi:UDP-N-acetylglucosamine 2-epimerase (non-hydrolysing)
MRLKQFAESKQMRLCLVGGARPNFMKIAPLVRAINKQNQANHRNQIDYQIVHTGQHYDYEMSTIFFKELGIPKPNVFLNVGSGSQGEQTGKTMIAFEKVLLTKKVDIVVVVGDVNSTIACALVAAKLHIPVAHVEAGLRSYDRAMPEEINRVLTDQISDYLFTPSPDANDNLRKEGVSSKKIFLVGNIMIDNLFYNLKKSQKSNIFKALGLLTDGSGSPIREYALLTLHRPSNVDRNDSLQEVIGAFTEISKETPIIFPIHPRTRKMVIKFHLEGYFDFHIDQQRASTQFSHSIHAIDPLGYVDFLALMSKANYVMTDSGGIQEETSVLGIPCLTLRDTTERPITLTQGTNILVPNNKKKIVEATRYILKEPKQKANYPKLWDGKTAERIVKILCSDF